MQKKLQQFKTFLFENPLLFFSILFIVLLPIYSGEIVSDAHAFILGKYINYLHIRVSLHLLIGVVLTFLYFKRAENRSQLLFFLSTFLISISFSLFPIAALSEELRRPFFALFLASGFHLFEFLVASTSLIIATGTLLSTSHEKQLLFVKFLFVSLCIQFFFGFAQFILKGPLLPTLFSWTGQPLEFTSKSILGIFEYTRIYGTTPHPNILAGILTFYSVLLLSVKETSLLKKLSFLIIAFLLVGTLSKSGILAFFLVFVLYFLRGVTEKQRVPIALAILSVFFTLIAFLLFAYLVSFPGFSATFLESRNVIAHLYLEFLTLNPLHLLFGTGFTMAIPSLLAQARQLPTSIIWGNQILAEPPHNILLLTAIELGIPTLLLLVFSFQKLAQATLSKLQPWQLIALATLVAVLGGLDHYLVY